MSLNFPLYPTDGQIYPDPKLPNLPQFQWSNASKTWLKILEGDQATETKAGIAEIATQAEVDAGTDDTRIVTPAKLNNWSSITISPQIETRRLLVTSNTTHTVSKGLKTFTFPNNPYLEFFIGQRLRAVYNLDVYMDGTVTAVSSNSITLNIDYVKGAALEYSNWNIGVSSGDNLSSMTSDNLSFLVDYIINSPELISLILTLS